ncbi:MAG: pyridoxamine 5'-phosphate oxidase family protein [Actinomycetota bacterium]
MSIRVEPSQLVYHVGRRPFAYVVSSGSGESPVHVVAVAVTLDGAAVDCSRVGGSTRRNIGSQPRITLVWPPHEDATEFARYTVIADGRASINGESVIVEVESAILHRPADV